VDELHVVFEKLSVNSLLHNSKLHVGNAYDNCSFHFDAISEDQVLFAKRPYRVDPQWVYTVRILSLTSHQIVAATK